MCLKYMIPQNSLSLCPGEQQRYNHRIKHHEVEVPIQSVGVEKVYRMAELAGYHLYMGRMVWLRPWLRIEQQSGTGKR